MVLYFQLNLKIYLNININLYSKILELKRKSIFKILILKKFLIF